MVVVLDKDVLLVIIVIIPFRAAVVMVGRVVCVLVVVMGMEILASVMIMVVIEMVIFPCWPSVITYIFIWPHKEAFKVDIIGR